MHVNRPVIRPSDDDLNEMAKILSEGTDITIYAGAGCSDAHDELVELAKRLQAPVAHTTRGKDAVEYDNPYNVGMTGVVGMEAGYHSVLNCDTLLLLGTDFAWRQFYPSHSKIIQVDNDPMHIGRRHPVHLGVVGNIKDTLEALLPRIPQRESSKFLDSYVARHKKSSSHSPNEPFPGLTTGFRAVFDFDHRPIGKRRRRLLADDGTPVVWLHRMVKANGRRRMFGSLLHGTMASAVTSAIGLQQAQPGRQVVAMAGMAASRCFLVMS